MAARGRILGSLIFLFCAILPLLASAHPRAFPSLGRRFKHRNFTHSLTEERTFRPLIPGNAFFPGFKEPEKKGGKQEDDRMRHHREETDRNHRRQPGRGYGDRDAYERESKAVEKEKSDSDGKEGKPPVKKVVGEGLVEGFYKKKCPEAEKIVKEVLNNHIRKDVGLAAAIVRLFVHDCFVKGCDASILLDQTPSGEDVEKKALANGPSVRGYEAIDDMKAQLEEVCPGVVSCADILAFANRDSLVFTGLPDYKVAAGRRDGLSSVANNTKNNLPLPSTPVREMVEMFQRKGLNLEELVVLTGAHSIDVAHCYNVNARLYDEKKSAEMDPAYASQMRTMCAMDANTVPFDPLTQHKMDSVIYREFLEKKALLESDHLLSKDPRANDIMKKLAGDDKGWFEKFIPAIIKMGEIEVLTGNDEGEIRKQCRAVN